MAAWNTSIFTRWIGITRRRTNSGQSTSFPFTGKNDRRPDIVIFINGLPLVVFELKNPYSEKPTVDDAYNQIQHYTHDISQLFDYNAFVVVSDGVTTLHGVWTAGQEWYSPWKSIDGVEVEPNTTGSMKTLIEGLFPKERLLEYIHDFLVFEVVNEKVTKKGARYHQFFAVRLAAQKVIETYQRLRQNPSADRRVGVIWHTTGSGKSLSMAFLVGILRRAPSWKIPSSSSRWIAMTWMTSSMTSSWLHASWLGLSIRLKM